MAKDKALAKKDDSPLALPAHMQGYEGASGKESMRGHIIPNLIKAVNDKSEPEVLELFRTGDIIIRPANVALVEAKYPDGKARGKLEPEMPGRPVLFTPLFFFVEYMCWADYNERGANTPPILERTTDPKSVLARKCESAAMRDETRDGIKVHNQKHLNFLIVVHEMPELERQTFLLSFARGEFKYGNKMMSLLNLRQGPIFGANMELFANWHQNKKNDRWVGIEARNPVDKPAWVDAEMFEWCRTQHQDLRDSYENNLLSAADLLSENDNGEGISDDNL